MKLPSHLAKSRHGVYYFRFSYRVGFALKEKRISLQTKNPQEARAKAVHLSLIMLRRRQMNSFVMQTEDFADLPVPSSSTDKVLTPEDLLASGEISGSNVLERIFRKLDKDQLAEITGLPVAKLINVPEETSFGHAVRKMDLEFPNGMIFRDVQNDDDAARVLQILKSLNLSTDQWAQLLAGKEPVYQSQAVVLSPAASPASAPQPVVEMSGATVQEMKHRFATRKRKTLTAKTLYEYGNYHNKFIAWLETRKKSKHIPIRSVQRADIADFIDDLLEEGLSGRTIQQKYLAAINGLFELAQSTGALLEGQQLVSRGHKILTKTDLKKATSSTSYKAFTDEELAIIFRPEHLCRTNRPADFWLPLLGLFTGARISELCQLDVTDIQKHGDIWAISINDEGDKSLKTLASNRLIPIHPVLLDIGFLDYVADAKEVGTKLFPYLTPDTFGSYGATPSERWGKYLDSVDIADSQKGFHSFRSTSNNRLKQNGVDEESRCQFIGHEHDTINSAVYSDLHKLDFLLQNVASKLTYPNIDFGKLKYSPGQFRPLLEKLCRAKAKRDAHSAAKKARKGQKPKTTIPIR